MRSLFASGRLGASGRRRTLCHLSTPTPVNIGFAIQDALARNDRRALAQLAPCTCDDYDFTDECPAKVWDGCRAIRYEEWDSRGSDVYGSEDYDGYYDESPNPDNDIPDMVALTALVDEIAKSVPTSWVVNSSTHLTISHEASNFIFVVKIENDDLNVIVESDAALVSRDSIKLPPRTYFTAAWILRILQPLFIKYHP